jgi:hypothetical protein
MTVDMLSVVRFNVVIKCIIMWSVIGLSVLILNAVAPFKYEGNQHYDTQHNNK